MLESTEIGDRSENEELENVRFIDLFDLDDIQHIQDDFSSATGAAIGKSVEAYGYGYCLLSGPSSTGPVISQSRDAKLISSTRNRNRTNRGSSGPL